MSDFRSEFLHTLNEREFIYQVSDAEGLDELAERKSITAYIGFDSTASSLHVGSLLPIMMLFWLQKTNHRPIALLGGGTTKIGDPSGKEESRRLLDDFQISENLTSIGKVFQKFLLLTENEQLNSPLEIRRGNLSNELRWSNVPMGIIENNAKWLDELNYIKFLRDVGRHFSVNRMLSFESVKTRLDRQQELTFLEFNYMILQAYDFVELYEKHDCVLQMGGSDQWGNICNGIELAKRQKKARLFALTSPLITTAAGSKMGKTAKGAVWLDRSKTSPYEYYQYWRNTHDDDVVRFLKLFTTMPISEISRHARLRGEELNETKKELAFRATEILHGTDVAEEAAGTARRTFEEGTLAENLPTVEMSEDIQKLFFGPDGLSVLIAAQKVGFARSTGEARRLIEGRGLRVNDVPVELMLTMLNPSDLTPEGVIKLSLGRKRHVLLKPV